MNCFWNSRLSLLNSRTVKRKLFVRSYATESGSHQFPKEGIKLRFFKLCKLLAKLLILAI